MNTPIVFKSEGTVATPDRTTRFHPWESIQIVSEDCLPRERDSSKFQIQCYREEFERRFFSKIELPGSGRCLRHGHFQGETCFKDMVAYLGGDAKVEVTLSEVCVLIGQELLGPKASFNNTDHSFIFFVRDLFGDLCALGMDCYEGDWSIVMHDANSDVMHQWGHVVVPNNSV